ncbi:hypothetical protein KQX54_016121 [Cotesia glomerata]|uniref:C2H2-type domain-containing protein n=1 Tax=Cotesia glomerata TaxID=32391 RepID=A0AAV7IYV2_COTGL|nr:hypothetical protein KQX54_016121 [Cotesia glomerata]
MSGIKLNSSSNIPSKYLPSVVLQRLDIPKDSPVYVINTETSEKEKSNITQSKQNFCDRNCKDLTPNHEARHKILSIEYICQRCHQSFETTELHSQHVLNHYSRKERKSSESSDSRS